MNLDLRKRLSAGVALGVLTVILTSPAAAQSTVAPAASADESPADGADTPGASEPAASSGEIVVTAQRREQSLQDVPVSISVMTGEALEELNIQNLVDFSIHLPQVKLASVNQTDFMNIRGVGSGNNAGFQQSVGTFVDDVYLERARAIRAGLFDVERIEVLKGPQTLFFGNNAIAGALNITTRKPEQNFDYDGSVLYDPTRLQITLAGGVTLPVTGTLSMRFAGRLSSEEGYVYNTFLHETGPNSKEAAGRLSLRWEPNDDFRSDLRLERSRSRITNAVPYQLLNCPPDPSYGGPAGACARHLAAGGPARGVLSEEVALFDTFADYDASTAAWTNAYTVGEVTFNSITSYFEHQFENLVQLIPTSVPGTSGGGALPGNNHETFDSLAQELRVEYETGGAIDLMAGGYYSSSDLRAPYGAGYYFIPAGVFVAPIYSATTPIAASIDFRQQATTLSAFASSVVRFGAGLQVEAGLRYSNVRKEAFRSALFGTNGVIPSPATLLPAPPAAQTVFARMLGLNLNDFAISERQDDAWQPSVRLQYDLTPDMMTYASYSKGFKAGGFDGGSTGSIFGPESVDAFEVGLKSSWLNRRLTLNLVGFHSIYYDLQESSNLFLPSGAVQSTVANAATSISQGIEILALARLSDKLSLNADITYLDSHYEAFPNALCTILEQARNASCIQDMSGKRRAYSPEWSGNFGFSYTVPVGNFQLKVSPLAYFTSDFFQSATADPLLRQEGNIKFDVTFAVGPEDGKWQLAVIGKNLTNELTSSFRAGVATAPGSVYASLDPTRSVALQFTVRR